MTRLTCHSRLPAPAGPRPCQRARVRAAHRAGCSANLCLPSGGTSTHPRSNLPVRITIQMSPFVIRNVTSVISQTPTNDSISNTFTEKGSFCEITDVLTILQKLVSVCGNIKERGHCCTCACWSLTHSMKVKRILSLSKSERLTERNMARVRWVLSSWILEATSSLVAELLMDWKKRSISATPFVNRIHEIFTPNPQTFLIANLFISSLIKKSSFQPQTP